MITQECILSISEPLATPAHTQKNRKLDFTRAITDDDMGVVLEYRQLSKHPQCKQTWQHSYGNEIGRLAQGMSGQVQGMNTVFFVHKQDIPQTGKKTSPTAESFATINLERLNQIGPG